MEKRWSRKKRAKGATESPRRAPVLDRVRHQTPEDTKAFAPTPDQLVHPQQSAQPTRPIDANTQHQEQPERAIPQPVETEPSPASDIKASESLASQDPGVIVPTPLATPDIWPKLASFDIDKTHLERHRIITAARHDPAHTAFDVLRTKLLRALRDNGWTRIAVTSPTEGCGKTFMASNLALSLSRQANCRTVLLDMDMRRPSVAKVLGIKNPGSMGDFLRGEEPLSEFLQKAGENDLRIGDNLAIGGNSRREDYASELLQLPETAETLDNLEAQITPDVILFDMPPALVNDDVLAARSLFDGVLLIVGGGITKPNQIRSVEQRLGVETPLLGVVLNRSEGEQAQSYSY